MRSPTEKDRELISRALEFARKAHGDNKRMSGEPCLAHLIETAKNLANLKADKETISAGILHDILEDTDIKREELEKEFGGTIVFLVDGVTKLGKIKYRGLERHAESLRKLFVATAKDVRVLLIKLADRLHNIKTLQYINPEKRRRIALETLEIYAPIANRLGMGHMKGTLEDEAFPYLKPKEYAETLELRQKKTHELAKTLEKVNRIICKKLAKEGFTKFWTDFRVKHLYSLHKKLERYEKDIGKIFDISALRIITLNNKDECYRILGIIHNMFKPLPERLKDYIAVPKPNGYQSIHTVVFSGDGEIIEIQIRTEEMHWEAEFGIASHLVYDEANKPKSGGSLDKKIKWIKQLFNWQKNIEGSEDFLENLKTDFFNDRIFVFTPKGDVIELPIDSSPIDFAFQIHSEVGNHAFGAKVNGKMVSFDTKLKNNDIVEIIVKEKSEPSQKWLEFAKTTDAVKHIKIALEEKSKCRNL